MAFLWPLVPANAPFSQQNWEERGVTAAPSSCGLSGAHQHSLWAEGECWHEDSEGSEWGCELPKLQAITL